MPEYFNHIRAVNYQSEDNFLSAGDTVHLDASEVHSRSGHFEEPPRASALTPWQCVSTCFAR